MSDTISNVRLRAVNQHRKRTFGDRSLKVYTATPETGEVEAAEFEIDWFGHRVEKTTEGSSSQSGAWQFQISAAEDWATTQTFMKAIVALTIGDDRWKVTKVEKPIGRSLMWKVRAQMQ